MRDSEVKNLHNWKSFFFHHMTSHWIIHWVDHHPKWKCGGDVGFNHQKLLTTLLVLLSTQLLEPVLCQDQWNTTNCPVQCHCQLHSSEINSKVLLKMVSCTHQQLKSVPSNIPAEVEALLLSSNELSDVYDYIPHLWGLKELDLTSNAIHSLGRDNIFLNLSELTYLNLAKNELTSIVRDVFNGLVQLQVLILSENKISYVEAQAFEGLSRLSTLNLGCNQLNSVEPESFYGLLRLTELYIYENRLSVINSAAFSGVKRLRQLSLHGNRLRRIASDGLSDLRALTNLQLERNNFEKVPSAALYSLKSLKILYLSSNPIIYLRAGDFSSLPVEELALNSMLVLKMIEAKAFYNLTQLVTLDIHDCPRLSYIDAEALVNLTVLSHINLQNNHLRSVPSQIFRALQPAGGDLALKGNPLCCDCNIRWMRKEMELEKEATKKNRSQLSDISELLCDEPSHTHGAQLRQLDFNLLTTQCPPSIFSLMETQVEKSLGESLSLDCRAQGIPTPKISWRLPGGLIMDNWGNGTSNHVKQISMRKTGTLYFYHLKVEDSGNYTCLVENVLGNQETTVLITVHRLDILLFPTGISSTFVTLVWNGTARARYNKFKITYQEANSSSSFGSATQFGTDLKSSSACDHSFSCITVTPFHHSHNIGNLHPDTKYEFCLNSEDSEGFFVQLSCTVAQTQNLNYMLQGIHRVSNVAVAAVLGIIVTMVIVICVVTVAAKKYRHRQYVCPDKYPVHRMSHIPMENLYCPLMSNASPY